MYYAGFFLLEFCLVLKMPLTERMGFYGTDTDSRRSADGAFTNIA